MVFISSRIVEMQRFREKAERAIADAGMRHVFVDPDTVKRDVRVVRQIEEAVKIAHAFVGLYGYTLDTNPVPKGFDRHYLELEFGWAQEAGRKRLCYAPKGEPAGVYADLYVPPAAGFDRDMLKFRDEFLEYGIGFLTTPEALYEDLLGQLRSLKSDVFVSYSSKDFDFAQTLVKSLRESGYSPWFNMTNIEPGDEWEPELLDGLKDASLAVLVVSPDSMQSSWVRKEWETLLAAKKPVLQLLYKEVETPPELKAIQGIKVKDGEGWRLELLREIATRL
jgi:hypothetical protein